MDDQRTSGTRAGIKDIVGAALSPTSTMVPIPESIGKRFGHPLRTSPANPEPWVIDANELRDDILRNTRIAAPTMLLRAAAHGEIRMYCAPHVIREVDEQIRDWARARHDPGAAEAMWRTMHRRLVRCVQDDPDLGYTAAELERLAWLAAEDSDDIGTARLCLALQARLASKDEKVLRAVYGRDVPWKEHHQSLVPALAGASQHSAIRRTQDTAVFIGGLGIVALVAAVRRWPQVAAALGGATVGLLLSSDAHGNQLRDTVHRGWTATGETLALVGEVAGDIAARLDSHPQAPLGPADLVDELGSGALRRLCLWRMARLPAQDATATELSAAWPSQARSLRTITAIRAELHACRSLEQVSRGRFQLGTPLGAQTAFADSRAGPRT